MEKIEKSKLKKVGQVKYVTDNPNIDLAEITIFDYCGRKLYHPRIMTTNKRHFKNNVAYHTLDVAKKAIDFFHP